MSHTPGPWTIEKYRIGGYDYHRITSDAGDICALDETELHNADIIAAAPELLMCLKSMLTEFDDMGMVIGNARAASAAIAKAEGI